MHPISAFRKKAKATSREEAGARSAHGEARLELLIRRRGEARVAEEFWSRVRRGEPGDCWPWISALPHGGYGTYRGLRAHRVGLALSGTRVPDHLVAMHRCDNPPCCNPAHLRLGTDRENSLDALRKGRSRAPLTAEQVREIRRLLRSGHGVAAIARAVGSREGAVQAIKSRNGYSWIPTSPEPWEVERERRMLEIKKRRDRDIRRLCGLPDEVTA